MLLDMKGKAMTDSDWLNEQQHPFGMVWLLRGTKVTRTKAGKRKLRLFACACCRLTWNLLTDPRLRHAVEVAEWFAEAQTGKDELKMAYEAARGLAFGTLTPDAPGHRERIAAGMAREAAHSQAFSAASAMMTYPVSLAGSYRVSEQEREAVLRGLLRCVLGNPFRPSPVLSATVLAWNDGTVRRIAEGIYEERRMPEGTLDTGRLAILADALIDAGCDSEDLIQHCREPGPHVRGCWAVDLILRKE
jgi:hypothetical protein